MKNVAKEHRAGSMDPASAIKVSSKTKIKKAMALISKKWIKNDFKMN